MSRDIGIDLGTSNVLISIGERGIALNEPSVVAMKKSTKEIIGYGEAAKRLQGRAPNNILVVKPLQDGVISEYGVTIKMLQYFLRKAAGTSIIKPRAIVCIPGDVTEVEEKTFLDAATGAGYAHSCLISEPVAAALGAGRKITLPSGNLVVDVGGGTTDIAMISLGGIISSKSLKIAGDKFDDAIIRYIRNQFNVLIGERTAETLKKGIGTLVPDDPRFDGKSMNVYGRCLNSGMPREITVYPYHIKEALLDSVNQILDAITEVIDNTPPELDGDIVNNGILLTGGSALLPGLKEVIADCIGVKCNVPKNPEQCVAIGTGKAGRYIAEMESRNAAAANRGFI